MPKNDNFTNNLLGLQRVTRGTADSRDTSDTKDVYRLNLKLSGDLKAYLSEEAWRKRTSITRLVNDILEDYAAGHPHEGES